MSVLEIERKTAPVSTPIRIRVSAATAFSGKGLADGIENMLGKLGCPKCFSGFDCRFQLERDFLIDPAIKEVKTLETKVPLRAITITVDENIGNDIGLVKKLVDKVRLNFGCLPCHSGFDFRFKNIIRELDAASILKR